MDVSARLQHRHCAHDWLGKVILGGKILDRRVVMLEKVCQCETLQIH